MRILRALLAGIAGVLFCLALAAAWTGGLGAGWGPFRFSLGRPLLAVEQALALLLLREAATGCPRALDRLRLLLLYAALLGALVLDSRPAVVGDGQEYVAMAHNLAHGRPPSLSPEELDEAEKLLPPQVEGYRLVAHELRGQDGRQDFYHPWAYSLLAAPFLRVAEWLQLPVLSAFSALNALLLILALAVVARRSGPRTALVVLGGAVLWWVDKAHTEVMTVALLSVALALLPVRPALSLVLQGLVGLQNATLGIVLVASASWLLGRGRLRERSTRLGLVGGAVLVMVGPLYSLWHLGDLSPLSWTVLPHWPSLPELLAVLLDTNIGLVFAWPAWFVATAVATTFCLADASTRREHRDTILLVAGAVLVILFAATQPANLNHGGTRGVSRYALWLVPAAVPALARLERSRRWGRVALLALAGASLLTGLTDYHPRTEQRYVTPTPVAEWVWRRWPGVVNPLPEVFAERTAHFEGPGVVPTATPGCAKALLVGDGTPIGAWPLWCRPIPIPAACSTPGRYCYANRRSDGGTTFAPAPRQPAFDGRSPEAWAWGGQPSEALVRFLSELPWPSMRMADPRKKAALFAAKHGLGPARGQISEEVLLVWIERPRRGAWVSLHPGPDLEAILVDPQSATILGVTALDPTSPTTITIPYVSPLLLAVVPERMVPPGLEPTLPAAGSLAGLRGGSLAAATRARERAVL